MKQSPIKLSALSRRLLGMTPAPAPRVRHEHEALPPENNLFARPRLTAADLGQAPPQRPGSADATALPSRGPFRGGAV